VSNSEMSNFFVKQVEFLYFIKSDTKSRSFLTGAAQGFAARHTQRTSQPENCGERRSVEKGPFMDGHKLIGIFYPYYMA
jgi:hypothetical protein